MTIQLLLMLICTGLKFLMKRLGQHGWIHLRQSIHNPNIAVNMQSMAPGGCLSMTKTLRDKFLVASGMDKILDIYSDRQLHENST
ncbi:hypothetical protein OIU84_021317 [Salix udensis]|uniref:Uncharacterized protein n=1 Tax=Salix udensis TaxID=889485 RepID=A0AAD6PGX8_9ROSI|nr:hypothetical protein OIU84_021317 [Salix udensis]